MITATPYANMRIAVFGLGRTGLAAVRALLAARASVVAWDDADASRMSAAETGCELADLSTISWGTIDALMLSPGVPLTHPEPHWTVNMAKGAGVPIIGDTEIFVRALAEADAPVKLIAITGTNGKSTTTALIGHMFESAGRPTEVGGNIGRPVLDLSPPSDGRHYVVEFSSYQIDLTPSLKPDVGILLNLSPDHLDRHGDMAGYAAVKARMFTLQGEGDTAVIGVDDDYCRAIAGAIIRPGKNLVSVQSQLGEGIWVEDGILHDEADGERCDLTGFDSLRGRHNWQNAAMAWATGRALGLSVQEIARAFASFPGLAHRMENVARLGRILFVNDSKATNADASAHALDSFDNIYWIAGGLAKSGGIEGLSEYFGKLSCAYLIGEAAGEFAETLSGQAKTVDAGTIGRAVAMAARDAAAGGDDAVVLLSPACASFDQYRNFELRGDAFRAAVAALDGVTMTGEEAA
ncbi:MAG: UDP-N-acetylmuramoyl-L-alanine--D-glutamate ligase [Hyphomicrobiales bacterium]